MQHTRRFGFLATNRAPQNLEKIRGLLGIDTEGPREAAEDREDEENQAEEEKRASSSALTVRSAVRGSWYRVGSERAQPSGTS